MYKPEWVDSLKEGATRVFGFLQFDVCGHSELSKSVGPSAMQKMKKRLRDMGGRTAYLYGGWELGFPGDGAIYAFLEDQGTVSDATAEAGLHILHELIFFNELIMIDDLSSQPVALRLSCHRGEAKFSNDPGIMHGNAMNSFFKHERKIGLPNSVVITEALYDNLTSKILRNRFEKHKFSEELGMDLYRRKDLSEAVVEMTKIATEFKAYEVVEGKRRELPLLPAPIYTYTDAEGNFNYGTIFAFALGQNPEVFITFEKYPEGISCELARIGGAEEMHVLWNGRHIWWSDLVGGRAPEFFRSYINFSYADLEDGKLYTEPENQIGMNWQIINHGLTIDDNLTTDELGILCRDQNAVLHSVIESFQQIMPQAPALGFRPLYIFQRAKDEGSITDSTSDTNHYHIGLSTSDRYYSQIAYQFAHEFCHVYADPRITNWFIESVCEMMSQYTLERLSETWAAKPPFDNWRTYARKFEEYLDNHLREVHQRTLGIDKTDVDKQSLLDWLSKNTSDLAHEPNNWDRNVIIAEVIKPILEANNGSWEIILSLGRASSPYPETLTEFRKNSEFNFDKLQETVPENAKGIVQQLCDILLL